VPVRVASVPTGHGHKESLRDKGMMWVLNQAIRIGMNRLVVESCERVMASGKAQVILIEPAPEDGILFMYNPASFEARRRLLEYAYRNTRAKIAEAFGTAGSALERAGWRAKT
jgi:NTE family protein